MSSAAKPQIAEEASPAKRKSPFLLVAACVAACGAGGAVVYFTAPAALFSSGPADHASADDEADKRNAHGDNDGGTKDGAGHASARFRIVGDSGVYTPEAIVVSLRPSGRVRHLKLAIAVETSADSEAAFVARELRIRDALNTYLRAVDIAALEDPAAMDRIRAQIARRIELVVSPAPVRAVLITDFILS